MSEDFFYVTRNKILVPLVKKEPVLDAGCGTGIVTKPLVEKRMDVYSVDIDKRLTEKTKRFNKNKTFCLNFNKIDNNRFPKFGTILMPDVLEHIKDDVGAIRKAYSMLRQGGEYIISVPYHNFFWTKNDEVRGHIRRYSKKELKRKLKSNGFKVRKMILWNMLSVIPLFLGRLLGYRTPHESISKSKLNNVLIWYMNNIEYHLPIPIGSGLICVAEKK
jgi:SAM-dependent methyltransferase